MAEIIRVEGPAGPPGPAGPAGPTGGTHTHSQTVAAQVWTISHNLGYHPAGVRVIDSANSEIEGSVTYPDVNTAVITFGAPMAGTAYLS